MIRKAPPDSALRKHNGPGLSRVFEELSGRITPEQKELMLRLVLGGQQNREVRQQWPNLDYVIRRRSQPGPNFKGLFPA